MTKKFEILESDNQLTLIFKNQKLPYIMTVFALLIQYLAIIFAFFYYATDISMTIILTIIFVITVLQLLVLWYLAWAMLAQKKLELTSNSAIYSKELFGKIKNSTYPWLEITSFVSATYKEHCFVTIKKSDGKEIQLFHGISEDEKEIILPKLNKFMSSIK